MSATDTLADRKVAMLQNEGLVPCGYILRNTHDNRRATVDDSGRVQWFRVHHSGIMVPTEDKP